MKRKVAASLLVAVMAVTSAATYAPEKQVQAATAVEWDYSEVDVSWIDPSKPMVALTFDDGPIGTAGDSNSMQIQDVIEEYNAHCTFFYIGQNITDENKGEITRAMSLGCEIGNHTWAHMDLTSRTAEQMLEDVNSTTEVLSEITGLKNFLVRPPYFGQNSLVGATIKQPLIAAKVDTVDWSGKSAEDIVDTALSGIDDGSIVLMHETMPNTVEAVKTLIPTLVEQGYQLVTVSEMFKAKGIPMTSGKMYLSSQWSWVVDHDYVEPTVNPSEEPSPEVSVIPSEEPSPEVSVIPSEEPSPEVSVIPSEEPSPEVSVIPSEEPSPEVTVTPSTAPSESTAPEISSDLIGTYKIESEWNDGYQVQFTVTNNSNIAITNWEVQFTIPDEINNVWCAKQVSSENGKHVIGNAEWNGTIQPNASTTFGFTVTKNGSSAVVPSDILVTTK